MKKIILAVAATAALVAAMPATVSAQPRDGRDYRGGYDQRRDYEQRRDYDNRGAYKRQRWNNGTRANWRLARQIDNRQDRIDYRLDNLVRRRALGLGEARGIQRGLDQVEKIERSYKRDRDLSRREFQHLNQMLSRLEQDMNRRARN